MSRVSLILSIISLAIGCATPRDIHTADGKKERRIDCSGTMQSWDNCREDARDTCGKKGYRVVSQTGDSGIVIGNERIHRSSESIRKMTIVCRQGLSAEAIQDIRDAFPPPPPEATPAD